MLSIIDAKSQRKKCKFVFLFRNTEKHIELQFIKQYIQVYSLKTAHQNNHRSVMMTNFDSINSIGILSNPTNNAEIYEIDKAMKHLQGTGKQTFPLIYFDKLIGNDIFTENTDWNWLEKKNCNWIGKPKQDLNLKRFINREFDILIDLSFSKNYSLQYVFVQSKAKLKIMSTSEISRHFADLMLETSNPKNKLAFAKEIIHYLEIINKDPQ